MLSFEGGWRRGAGKKGGRWTGRVGAGNGRPLSRPRSQAGEARREGGRRVILKRDRYASLSRALSLSLSLRLPCSPSPPISCSSLIPHPCPLYTWPFVSPLRPTSAPLSHPFAAQ